MHQCIKGMLRPNNNQLYFDYMSLLIPTEYLQYLRILLTINCLGRVKYHTEEWHGCQSKNIRMVKITGKLL